VLTELRLVPLYSALPSLFFTDSSREIGSGSAGVLLRHSQAFCDFQTIGAAIVSDEYFSLKVEPRRLDCALRMQRADEGRNLVSLIPERVGSFFEMDHRQSKLHERFSTDLLQATEFLYCFDLLRGCSAGKQQLRTSLEKRIVSHKVRCRPDRLGIDQDK